MQLKHAAGNTWYLEDWQVIPLYKTSEHTCVLLDSGLRTQRDLIERTLERNGLTPVGILGSHVHGRATARTTVIFSRNTIFLWRYLLVRRGLL